MTLKEMREQYQRVSKRKRERAFERPEVRQREGIKSALLRLYAEGSIIAQAEAQPVVMASARASILDRKRDRSHVRAAIAAGLAKGRAFAAQIPRIREKESE